MKRDDVQNVIFLGAGASKQDKGLLQDELFREYFLKAQEFRLDPPTYETLGHLFADFFGLAAGGLPDEEILFPTCEEVLGIVETALAKHEGFRGNRLYTRDHLNEIRSFLVTAIGEIITKTLKEPEKGHVENWHDKLALSLAKKRDSAIVSTNYDILVDNAFERLGCLPDYGIRFTGIQHEDGDWEPKMPSISLYKIHGSLNWLYCPTCKTLDLVTLRKFPYGSSCNNIRGLNRCCDRRWPILVPPTYLKDMSNSFLTNVWTEAEEMLANAKRVFFCGYSFPDADIHVKYMMKRAQRNRNGADLEIYVLNYHDGKSVSQITDEYGRFVRFFGRSHVHYTLRPFKYICEIGIDEAAESACLTGDNFSMLKFRMNCRSEKIMKSFLEDNPDLTN